MSENTTKRIVWIDITKAAAAWMVVTAHLLRQGAAADYLAAVSVAVFYVLAGVTMHAHEDEKAFLVRLLRRIVLPYLVVGLISIAIYRVLGGYAAVALGAAITETTPGEDLWHLFYGSSVHGWMKWNESLWFLPCYCLMMFIAEGIEHAARRWRPAMPVLYVGGGVLGWLLITNGITGLPWHLETALSVLPLCGWGRYLRIHQLRKRENAWETALFGLLVFFLGLRMYPAVLQAAGGSLSLRSPQLAGPVLTNAFLVLSVTGVLAMVWYAVRGVAVPPCIAYIGRNSLDVVLWNKFPVLFLQVVIPSVISGFETLFIGGENHPAVVIAGMLAVPCVALCVVWSVFYRRGLTLIRHICRPH